MPRSQSPSTVEPLNVWIDVGGTFTDCIITAPDGNRSQGKVLSSGLIRCTSFTLRSSTEFTVPSTTHPSPRLWHLATARFLNTVGDSIHESLIRFSPSEDDSQARFTIDRPLVDPALVSVTTLEVDPGVEAPILAIRSLLELSLDQPLPPAQIRLGTTRGTNALLERTGSPAGFVTTAGFGDLLEIGTQQRDDLFALSVTKRPPLYRQTAEITERLDADGSVLTPIDLDQATAVLQELLDAGIDCLAVCLLHSYRNPEHEQAIGQIARQLGFRHVSLSSDVSPLVSAVPRAETSVVDAYLTPVIGEYLSRIRSQLGDDPATQFHVMTSAGGLVDFREYSGKDSILSGPAGGVVALGGIAAATGHPLAIGFDMGGTSTDVARFADEVQIAFESTRAGVHIMTPTMDIHTVAAGGGSVCWFDGVQLRVGPNSAGAVPGPASYGSGGPLTITDLNLLLGRIDPSKFQFELDVAAAKRRLLEIDCHMQHEQIRLDEDADNRLDHLASGFRKIANAAMADAVREITISQGSDPRDHALVGFGGAAGQHVCDIAEQLGIETIIDAPDAGLLSALGMGLADVTREESIGVYKSLASLDEMAIENELSSGRKRLLEKMLSEGLADSESPLNFRVSAELRYDKTNSVIQIDVTKPPVERESPLPRIDTHQLAREFVDQHKTRFGFEQPNLEIELATLRCKLTLASAVSPTLALPDRLPPAAVGTSTDGTPSRISHRIFSNDTWHDGWQIDRAAMPVGQIFSGPGMICSDGHTTIVDAHWTASMLEGGIIELRRGLLNSFAASASSSTQLSKSVDPVVREVIAQRLASIASQMGTTLQLSAISVNIRERRDFSCAVFDSNGQLIANAPHVPVHLGAMGETVRQIMLDFPRMHAGDCFVTNDPYRGGSHLPDVTVITPVFDMKTMQRRFFVASRAHHSEIGGMAPGSMTPNSRTLGDEGVVLSAMYLSCQGVDCRAEILQRLSSGRWPSRSPEINLAEIDAQSAANRRGEHLLADLVDQFDYPVIDQYMRHIREMAAAKTRRWITTLGHETRTFRDTLDDGTPICVQITPVGDSVETARLVVDFEGTGDVHAGNFNANPSIVTAAVLYSVRCHLSDTLPLNDGVMECIDLRIPTGLLNPPRLKNADARAAVAAGNVETSQRIVDVVLGALGSVAASQGTMNNVLFGNENFGYYETICGGTGATASAPGASAVHSHMTNTLLTDPEILESRYPVRLDRFCIRRGSGGVGRNAGGDGVVRQITALAALTVSLITGRRGTNQPYGVDGGQPGAAGINQRIDINGNLHEIPAAEQLELAPGESLLIQTPGGGGHGPPS